MTTATATPKVPERAADYDAIHFLTDARIEPEPYRFTADQVLKMAKLGIFHPDDRIELIEGEIVYMVPPGPMHSTRSDDIARAFIENIGRDRALVRVNGPIRISDGNILIPDLALLKPRADRYMYELPTPEDIFLVVEVSHSTLRSDRTRKLVIYAAEGIPAYWIFNVADRAIEAHSDLVDGEYATHNIYRPGDTITLDAFPDIELNASDIILPMSNPAY